MRFFRNSFEIFLSLSIMTFVVVTGCGDSSDQTQTISPPEPVQLSFTAKASGQLVRFSLENEADFNRVLTVCWDFGDGSTSHEVSPVHRYNDIGVYSVTLVWEDMGMRTGSKTGAVEVGAFEGVDLDWDLVLGEQNLSHTSLAGGPPGFVMVGNLGKLLFSENGFDWLEVQTQIGVTIKGVLWFKDAFWAFGSSHYYTFAPNPEEYSVIVKSTDGQNWIPARVPDFSVSDLATNESTLVLVGQISRTDERGDPFDSGVAKVSVAGGPWQEIPLGGNGLSSIFWNGSRFIASGYVSVSSFTNPSYYISSSVDGLQWERHQSSIDPVAFPTATDGTRFVRTRFRLPDLEMGTSEDGLNWSTIGFEMPESMHAIAWGKDRFVAIGKNYVLTSSKGEFWETHALPVELDEDSRLAFSNGVWLIHAPTGPLLWSGNGYEWTPYPRPMEASPSRNWIVVAPWKDGFVIGSSDGIIATSEDGLDWKEQWIHPDFQIRGIAEINDDIWASGFRTDSGRGTVFRRRETWQPVFTTERPLREMVQFGGRVFAVEEGDRLFTADLQNVENWHLISGLGDLGVIKQLYVSDDALVLLGTHLLFTSKDGVNWQSHQLPLNDSYAVCRWNGTWFVAGFGGMATKATTLLRSDNLKDWQFIPFDIASRISHLASGASKLVAIGNHSNGSLGTSRDDPFNMVLSSRDGFVWQPETAPPGVVPADLSFNQDRFIAVGNSFVWRQKDP